MNSSKRGMIALARVEKRELDQASHMILRVQCYAGRKPNERPVRFRLGDREYVVEARAQQTSGDWNLSDGSDSQG